MEALAIRRALLSFYRRHGRALPWRRTRDPYAIWVSEVMLQQTQVETVIPRFAPFLRQFPSVDVLAKSEESAVCEAWAGLGYYRRARHLHQAARKVMTELDGRCPTNAADWRRLPGIGDYTSAAIASIVFGERAPAIDGNLVRVLARVRALPGRASDRALVATVRAHAQALVDCDKPGDVNQALMDIGATLCRPESPACDHCPLRAHCRAFTLGKPTAYPGRKARTERTSLSVAFAWIADKRGVRLEQRSLDGLWPGLWEPPSASGQGTTNAKVALTRRLGARLGRPLARITHELTHRRVTATVYRASTVSPGPGQIFSDPLTAPLSALARKAIAATLAQRNRQTDKADLPGPVSRGRVRRLRKEV